MTARRSNTDGKTISRDRALALLSGLTGTNLIFCRMLFLGTFIQN